jgi:SMODS-associated and fused to various effectors sensor domain
VATNLKGQSFLSYRRTRKAEAELLIAAQHDIGIPTWRDVHNLDEEQTDAALERILSESVIANAILWLTPDVADSHVIRRVEVPNILRRLHPADGFFVVPVCAGGLQYEDVSKILDPTSSLQELSQWNLRKYGPEPILYSEAAEVASRVLARRIDTIHKSQTPEEPLKIGFFTQVRPPARWDLDLAIDWFGYFTRKLASAEVWQERLFPALRSIAESIRHHAPGREIVVEGFSSISAAFCFGTAFQLPGGMKISWVQNMPFSGTQLWCARDEPKDCGFTVTTKPADVRGCDLAVLVSVASDVHGAFAATRSRLPAFRAIVDVSNPNAPSTRLDGEEAADLAIRIVQEIRTARQRYAPLNRIHFFMAVPTGLAAILGQLTNTLGPLAIYEHMSADTIGEYSSAVILDT